jgi:hypothetical protein
MLDLESCIFGFWVGACFIVFVWLIRAYKQKEEKEEKKP